MFSLKNNLKNVKSQGKNISQFLIASVGHVIRSVFQKNFDVIFLLKLWKILT